MLALLVSVALLAPITAPAASPAGPEADSAARLAAVSAELWDGYLELNPLLATEVGDHRFDHRFGDGLSDAWRSSLRRWAEQGLAATAEIEAGDLSRADLLTLELLRRWLQAHLTGLDFPDHLLPVSHAISSPQVLLALEGSGGGSFRFASAEEVERFGSRCADFRQWVEIAIARMREGIAGGVVQPCSVVDATLAQIEAQVVDSPRASPFWAATSALPQGVRRSQRRQLEARWETIIATQVVPAYTRLHAFLRDEYRPACRTTLSLAALPDGVSWYRHQVRLFTTTERSPEEIFSLGVAECQRLIVALDALARSSGYAGGLSDLLNDLARNRRHFLAGERAVLARYERIRATVERELPRLFLTPPSLGLEIRSIEPSVARTAPGAFYRPPTPDGERAGVFFVNAERPLYPVRGMDALFLHEALPGHHLQHAAAVAAGDLPSFRRHSYHGAFIEGWALYAESLGDDLGLYRDPVQQAGRLLSELLRAARLVVDTGIHQGGWSRAEAEEVIRRQLLGINLGELDRYAVIPGQALTYTIGAQAILELERTARARLGDAFDVRAFHARVLGQGPLPLDLLEREVRAWVDGQLPADNVAKDAEGHQ